MGNRRIRYGNMKIVILIPHGATLAICHDIEHPQHSEQIGELVTPQKIYFLELETPKMEFQ